LRLNLIGELHCRGLGGNFGVDKTRELVDERYFFPNINKYVKKFVECCKISQLDKGRNTKSGLYTPLPVLKKPWEDISMYFDLGLPKKQ
jgi:hypothetical protein